MRHKAHIENSLVQLRERVNLLDILIVPLIAERLRLARRIGKTKKNLGRPLRDRKREREVLSLIQNHAKGLPPHIRESVTEVYTTLLKQMRDLQCATGEAP